MAVKYQNARVLIASSLVAAVVGGTGYFVRLGSPVADVSTQTVNAPVAAPDSTTTRVTTRVKAKTTRGS